MNTLPDKRIVNFIKEHHVLTLATSYNNRPYCCNCFYTYIEDLNLFVFASDTDTQHIEDIKQNEKVSASIVLETKTVGKIQGLQITGTVESPTDELKKTAKKHYLKAFPFAVLKPSSTWVLKVDFMKYTDNRLGFGKKIKFGEI